MGTATRTRRTATGIRSRGLSPTRTSRENQLAVRCLGAGARAFSAPASAPSRRELPDAPLAARLEVGPLVAAEIGRRVLGEPPLAPDPVPVARRPELSQDGQHAG